MERQRPSVANCRALSHLVVSLKRLLASAKSVAVNSDSC